MRTGLALEIQNKLKEMKGENGCKLNKYYTEVIIKNAMTVNEFNC